MIDEDRANQKAHALLSCLEGERASTGIGACLAAMLTIIAGAPVREAREHFFCAVEDSLQKWPKSVIQGEYQRH